MKRLESSRLNVIFNENNGLSVITDNKTKTEWRQFYPIPPADATVWDCNLSDSTIWETDFSQSGNGLKGIFEEEPFKLNMKRNFPIPGISIFPGNYEVCIESEKPNSLSIAADVEYYTTILNRTGEFLLKTVPLNFKKTGFGYSARLYSDDMDDCTDAFILNMSFSANPKTEFSVKKVYLKHCTTECDPVTIKEVREENNSVLFTLTSGKTQSVQCRISVEDDTVTYELEADENEPFRERLTYPPMPHTGGELNWIVPKDSGLRLSACDIKHEANFKIPFGEFYVVPGLNMAFLGADAAEAGGCMMIVDTPLCARVGYTVANAGGTPSYLPHLQFFGDKGIWAQNRKVRFKFLENGNYVEMAKQYRKIAFEKGFLDTFLEKEKRDETFKKSVGTHRIDSGMDYRDMPKLCDALYKAGTKNVLLKFTASRNNGAYLNGTELFEDGILKEYSERYSDITLYEYENTRDLYLSAGEFALDKEYADFAKDYRVKSIKGKYLCGWVDIMGNAAYILCPHFAKKYLDFRLKRYPLKDYPYKARLFDVLATTSLTEGECYDTAHECSRLETAEIRKEILDYARKNYRLDVHTEGTAEYLIPYCNTFEGSLSIMNYPGISHMQDRYEMDFNCRIPFWQLVYHDCASTYFHWEHGDLTHPTIPYDDALVMLYGERGMFLPFYSFDPLNTGLIDRMTDRIKTLNIVLERVKYDSMEEHSFLTPDGAVQRTRFSSGVTVTANLEKNKSYQIEGRLIEPWSVLVEQDGEIIFKTENESGGNIK